MNFLCSPAWYCSMRTIGRPELLSNLRRADICSRPFGAGAVKAAPLDFAQATVGLAAKVASLLAKAGTAVRKSDRLASSEVSVDE